jgi:membrane associated rhomboid family serine protease
VPPLTQTLIVANVVVFLLETLVGAGLIAPFALWPLGPLFRPWQPLTYAFLHGSLMHLAFNMFGLYMFGSDVERVWGARRYAMYYAGCALSAALVQIAVTTSSGSLYPTVGASGALFGLLIAYARLFPRRVLVLLFPPIPMRAPVFVAVYGALEVVLGVTGTQQGVAHFAHLGGLAGGFLLMRFWRAWR